MKILIWDSTKQPPKFEGRIVFWRSSGSTGSLMDVSIPSLIEENSDKLKARYLAWIYDLGQLTIQDSHTIDILKIRKNLSYWWMTPIAEKFNYSKSPQITDALRLMAFDMWASNHGIKELEVLSSNSELIDCLLKWSKSRNLQFKVLKKERNTNKISMKKRIYSLFPQETRTLAVFIRYLIGRWPLRKVGLLKWRESTADVTFISYLFGLSSKNISERKFQSQYWAHLPDKLEKSSRKTRWLHMYIKDGGLPTSNDAAKYINKLNIHAVNQVHTSLDSFLSIKIVWNTISEWKRLKIKIKNINRDLAGVTSEKLDLWALFQKEWQTSATGPGILENLLILNLFESALSCVPEQSLGIYLFEQQPWELALISTWKACEHKKLVGSQHTTMLFWDLRYFHDERSYIKNSKLALPLPDELAVNGPRAMSMALDWHFPAPKLIESEALRYLHLSNPTKSKSVTSNNPTRFRLLVLTDYLESNVELQMKILESAMPLVTETIEIIVKSHPNSPIADHKYNIPQMRIDSSPIGELLADCRAAFTSAATSAAVDAYCAGVPVISLSNLNELNLSPLRGLSEVTFINTAEELAIQLDKLIVLDTKRSPSERIFNLDTELTLWKKILQ